MIISSVKNKLNTLTIEIRKIIITFEEKKASLLTHQTFKINNFDILLRQIQDSFRRI